MLKYQDEVAFLAREYQALWKEWDIEPRIVFKPRTRPRAQAVALLLVSDDISAEAAGLLEKIITAMGVPRSQVAISSVESCRAQIEAAAPRLIVAFGEAATNELTGAKSPRGKFQAVSSKPSVMVMPTHAPAILLRTPQAKKETWDDLKVVMAQLEKR